MTTSPVRALAALVASAALLGAACSDDDDQASTTTTTSAVDTTTTTGAPTTTAAEDGAAIPEGDGCTPGPGRLPDGRWYGLVESTAGDSLTFDLACWFTGEEAVRAAAEDGDESPPPNDYHVRNDNPATRDVPVTEDTTVEWYPTGDPNDPQTVSYAEWASARTTRAGDFAVWLVIDDGVIRTIEEQWVP